MSIKGKEIIVVGAGIGGMTVAALLSKEGYGVKVVEKNDQPGGREIVHKDKGFAFDMGPSWYLMPEVFEDLFGEFGKKPSDYYDLVRLDPSYRVFLGDGKKLDISADLRKNMELFDSMEKDGGRKLKEYLESASYQYKVAMSEFINKEYRSIFDFLNKKLVLEGTKLHVFDSLDGYAKKFIENPDLRKILEYTIVFLGGTPQKSPAMYALMSHVDFKLGVWYPMEGMGKLSRSFHKLCREQGVEFVFDEEVKEILVKEGKATGVRTEKGTYQSDMVIVNADYAHSEIELLDKGSRSYSERYWNKKSIAPSCVLIYVGLDKKVEGLQHHNLYLSSNWDEHFRTIFDKPAWPKDPSYYICCPSKTDDSVAPEGQENLFFLVPVAAGLDDTDEIRERYYEDTLKHLEGVLGEPILDHVVSKRIVTHRDFSSLYNSYKGTALGLAHTLRQTAVFRPSHYSKKVKDLYYTGQYTHPGIGVPMVVISSKILAGEIVKTHG
ncbi:MAG: phytoene desaturase family protein [Thermoplasmatota archaeon]